MTILYASDWLKYPNAIIDTKTKNVSFLRLAAVYRAMGVQNHAFILSLLNPALQGVDPYDPELTIEQMAMVAVECRLNFWYYIREVARAPAIGGSGSTFVEANRGNVAAWWLFLNHVMFTLIQPRQTGKSFSIDELMVWLLDIGCLNTKINLLTKDDTLRRANIVRIKEIRAEMPFYLCQQTGKDANNTEELTVMSLGNRYTTHVPQSSPKRALNLGRGLTTGIFHIDEPPFQPNIGIALPAALAAMGAAIDKAKAEGAPYGVMFTTTAGKKDDRDGKWFYNFILAKSAIWTEKFFDCANQDALEKMIRSNTRGGEVMVNLTFNHRQLGKTDQWMLSKLEGSLQSGDDANRDYFNMWTAGSQSHPLPIHILERIANSMQEVAFAEISGAAGYIIRWYLHEDEIQARMNSGRYILGMDTSEASGGDDISLVIIDVETLEVVACGTFNETNLFTFSQWVANLLIRFPTVTAMIERRSTGQMLLDHLLIHLPDAGVDPFKRLFNTIVQDYEESPDNYREIRTPMNRRDPSVYVRFKKSFGYATSGSGLMSRNNLYSHLHFAGKKAADVVRDQTLIEQINGLITKNGRIDHDDGQHDDMVIGWLLCMWFMTQGKNMSHYGIDTKLIMAQLGGDQFEEPAVKFERMKQLGLRTKMQELSDVISSTRDDYIVMRLEQEMRLVASQMIYEEGEIVSVDELVRQAKEKRRFRREAQVSQYNQNASNHPFYRNTNDGVSYGEYYRRA